MSNSTPIAEITTLDTHSGLHFNNFRQLFYKAAVLCACTLIYVSLLWSGIAAGPGFELRYDSVFLPFIIAAVFLGLARAPRIWEGPGLMLFSVTLCGVILSGIWTSAVSDHSLLAGLFPNSDSFTYLDSSVRLLRHGELTSVASRRPLSPAVGSVLFFLCQNNVKAVLALTVFLLALVLTLPVREVIRTHGWMAGYVMFLALLLFYRRFIGTALTEHLGLAFGCVAFALLWRSAYATKRPLWQAMAGIFVLALGLFARAGAFFVLPALVAWTGWAWRGIGRFSLKILVLGFAAVGAAYALNLAVLNSVGYPRASSTGNFPYVLYGLAHGGTWSKVFTDHPEVRLLPEIERNKAIYDLATRRISEKPFSLVEGALKAIRQMLVSYEGTYSFVFFALQRSVRENTVSTTFINAKRGLHAVIANPVKYLQITATYASFFLLSLLALIGIIYMFRSLEPGSGLLLCAATGILLSVPFAPPWASDLMRSYAATIPLLLALPAAGIIAVFTWFGLRGKAEPWFMETEERDRWGLMILALVLIPALCLSPILFGFVKNTDIAEADPRNEQIPAESRLIWLVPGSQVTIHAGGVKHSPWSSSVRIDAVRRNMGVLALEYPRQASELSKALDDGNTLALGYDKRARALRHLVLTDADQMGPESVWAHVKPVLPSEEIVWWKIQPTQLKKEKIQAE